MKLTLNHREFSNKPQANEVGKISSEIASEVWEGNIEDFAQELEKGRTWSSLFSPELRSKANWYETQVFGVDIDNCTPETDAFTLVEHSKEMLGYPPSIIHESFSHTPSKPKYRVIYKSSNPVSDRPLARGIMGKLIEIFGGDKVTAEESRLFYGCRSGQVVYLNNDDELNPEDFSPEETKKPAKIIPKKSLSSLTGQAQRREITRRKSLIESWENVMSNPTKYYDSGYECLFKLSLRLCDEDHWMFPSMAEKFLGEMLEKYASAWNASRHTHRYAEIYENARAWRLTKPPK